MSIRPINRERRARQIVNPANEMLREMGALRMASYAIQPVIGEGAREAQAEARAERVQQLQAVTAEFAQYAVASGLLSACNIRSINQIDPTVVRFHPTAGEKA
jgi:hypothetical protein